MSDIQPVWVIKDTRFLRHLERMPHMESSKRITAAFTLLEDDSLQGRYRIVPPRPASAEELALVHTPEHIRRVAASLGKPLTSFDLDTQATEVSYEIACLGVGAVFSLLDEIWRAGSGRGFAFVRPPGHHAGPDKAMGFCLFNNIALGARYLQRRHRVEKIMIVDLDAHHGNGTQTAFYDDDSVLYFSMHQYPAYPGTGNLAEVGRGKGEGFTVNVPLPKGCGDRDFAQVMYFLLKPIAEAFKPEMMLVSCGFDLYRRDPLCRMGATSEGYALMTFLLLELAERICAGRIAFVMEGGYSLKGIRECGLRVMQVLCGIPTVGTKTISRFLGANAKRLSLFKKIIEIQRPYWPQLV